MKLPPLEPESSASANSATSAYEIVDLHCAAELLPLTYANVYDIRKAAIRLLYLVRETGLEPVRCEPHAPQTCASASSATLAFGRCLRIRVRDNGIDYTRFHRICQGVFEKFFEKFSLFFIFTYLPRGMCHGVRRSRSVPPYFLPEFTKYPSFWNASGIRAGP